MKLVKNKVQINMSKRTEISIRRNSGVMYFSYLEQIHEWLEKVHHRKIDFCEEIENAVNPPKCNFTIDGVQYFFEQYEVDD